MKGVGLDIGTMNVVSSRSNGGEEIHHERIRDAFLDVPLSAKKMLKLHSGVSYIEEEDLLLIVGDHALEMAAVFGREARRPLKKGLINPQEIGSLDVLAYMIKQILGDPKEPNEICYFSVPAPPVDGEANIIYHKGVFERILTQIGYDAYPSNEAEAIVFSNCANEEFSGLAFSFGSGMTNTALVLNTIGCINFSIQRGGDWIDNGVASSIGTAQSRVTQLKETGFNLLDPQTRIEEALSFYYKELIQSSLDIVARKFVESGNHFGLNRAIPIIVSGGTSKAEGFVEFFKQVFKKKARKFPIEISEIRHATDPLNAVADGLLIQAAQEYE